MKITQRAKTRVTAILMAALLLLSTATPAMAETFSAIVTAASMTVYSDAKLTKKAGSLEKDTVVRITSYTDKAARITYAGRTGYAKVSDMQAVEDVAAKAVTNAAATVYQTPVETAKHSTVKAGTKLYVLTWSDEWAEVEKQGVVGYIRVKDLTKTDDEWRVSVTPTPAPTAAPTIASEKGTVSAKTMPVYKSASTSSKKLGTLKKGQVVNVITWDSKWAYIELEGRYGYCAVKSLTKGVVDYDDSDEVDGGLYAPVVVTSDTLAVYQKASKSSKKLGTLKKDQVVSLLSKDGDWAHIELNGNYGYCAISGLGVKAMPTVTVAPTPTPSVDGALRGEVIAVSLPVYKTASTSARKLLTLEKGSIVNVIKWNDQWAYIEYGGAYGFCDIDGLNPADAKATEKPAATKVPVLTDAAKATVTGENVYVYAKADTDADMLGALMWGETVNLLSVSGGWAYIEKDGKYGYCDADALTKVAADADDIPGDYKKADFTATVVDPDARRYEADSKTSESSALDLGQEVKVTAYSADMEWACIDYNGERAFVPIKQLSRTEYETVTSGTAMQTLLKALLSYGYFDSTPSANPDATASATAIKRFQLACGLSETGIADQTVQRILYAGHAPSDAILTLTLEKGDKDDNVTRLQRRLYALGYLSKSTSLDGDFGTTTAAAVALFQKASGLSATGTADPDTLKRLWSATAVSKPTSTKAADATTTSTSSGSSSGGSTVSPSGTVTLSSTYVTTMPSQLKSSTTRFSSSMSAAQKLEYVIYVAQSNLGKPYVYGATGTSSFDCSGLTQYCFKKANVNLKRTAYSQGYDSTYTKISSISSLKRGDLIFFNTISDSDLCDHVGIYLGGNCFIHASSGGHKVVVSSVASGYYNRVFSWGRRIIK